MSVYTRLSLSQVQDFSSQYGLQIAGIEPIQGGIENSNYFVQLQDGRQLVLTIFEEIDSHEAGLLVPVLSHLAVAGIPVASPLASVDGRQILNLMQKPAQLAPRLAGSHPMQPTLAQVASMGAGLARLHLALLDYDLQRESNHGQAWWQQTAGHILATLPAQQRDLLQRVFSEFSTAQAAYPQRPCGLIHGDLFRDNTLFEADHLTGVLDFSELSSDELLLDIAICLNDFCSAWPDVVLDEVKAQAFLQAYHQLRPLTADEQQLLAVYLAMAACRFWLSRLQVAQRNASESRGGEHVLEKDPEEMRLMLEQRMDQPFHALLS